MGDFQTTWNWNNSQVNTFTSTEIIGEDNTCTSDESLKFLHSTLVYTTDTTCTSLLIVIPSLPNYDNMSVPIECEATVNRITKKMTTYHNTISGES
jgi:hypothetical protein